MEVSSISRVVALVLCLATFSPSFAQSSRSRYDPGTKPGSPPPKDGFVDFTLNRINPSNVDYGQCLSESRAILVEETIKSGYFWSNITAVALLSCLFVIIVFQQRAQTLREGKIAAVLMQYQHALARANAQGEEATNKNRDLFESLGEHTTSGESQSLPPDARGKTTALGPSCVSSAYVHAGTVPRSYAAKATSHRVTVTAATEDPAGQIGLVKPEVELVTKINALEQQLGRSHEVERQLRRQLNDTGRNLQAEQQKNRGLKGE